MEIGSFLELQFPEGKEYYAKKNGMIRLNSGRAGIWHALRVTGCGTIWLPYYQCDTVKDFLHKKNVQIKFYHIDKEFNPMDIAQEDNEAVLIVNYYGIMSFKRLRSLAVRYKNVIIDNSQAFFAKEIEGCMNVYSARKFIGVPDGAYVMGEKAETYQEEYEQGYSSDTSLFMLQRIEYGCEGKSYESRMMNEHRIDREDIMRMSKLTYRILDGTDYTPIIKKRRENFRLAHQSLGHINQLNPLIYYDEDCVPMVYPLVTEDEELLNKLLDAKHYQGHWWSYLLDELPADCFEYWLSKFIIPITIDQRYGKEEIEYVSRIVLG